MTKAQQVRLWAGLGVGVFLALSVFGMAGSLVSSGNTLYTTNDNGFYAWFTFAVLFLLTEGILAGFTIYRFYKPATPTTGLHISWNRPPQDGDAKDKG